MAAGLVSGLVWLAVIAAGWSVNATLKRSGGSDLLHWSIQFSTLVVSLWFASVAHRQVLRSLDPVGWRRQEHERQESARRQG